MSQKISWSTFSAGLAVFATLATQMITSTTKWSDFYTPWGALRLVILGMAFIAMVGGALIVQLPRNGSRGERASDDKT